MTNRDWIIKKGSWAIRAHLSTKIILVDPNLVRTFPGNNFFDRNYGAHQKII